MGEYVIPSILGGGKFFMIGNLIGDEFVSAHDWAFGSALGMALIAVLLALIVLYFRVSRRTSAPEMGL
jgi:spermidine/putrescine transport system permease protein